MLVPSSPITHSRIWKGLIPHLARHYRVITFDGRGNGRSGRPADPESHSRAANVADLVAVLDVTETDRAVLVAHCHANLWAVEAIAANPGRVSAFVAIDPGIPYLGKSQPHWVETGPHWGEIVENPSWLGDEQSSCHHHPASPMGRILLR